VLRRCGEELPEAQLHANTSRSAASGCLTFQIWVRFQCPMSSPWAPLSPASRGSSELTAADVAHKPAEAIKSVGSIPVWQAADALYKIDNPAWVCAVPDLPAPPGFATHEAIDVVHQSCDVDLLHLITRATATAPRLAGYLYAASKALHEHDDEMMDDDSAPPSYTVGPLNALSGTTQGE